MPLAKIEKTGAAIKAVAALAAFFPGVAVLSGLVSIPPSLTELVRLIAFSVSIAVLLSVFLLGPRIMTLSRERVAIWTIIFVVTGSIAAGVYYRFATNYTVVVDTDEGRDKSYIIPFRPSQTITEMIAPFDHDYKLALEVSGQRIPLRRQMALESGESVSIMILLLVLAEVLLIAPIVVVAWRVASDRPIPEDAGEKE